MSDHILKVWIERVGQCDRGSVSLYCQKFWFAGEFHNNKKYRPCPPSFVEQSRGLKLRGKALYGPSPRVSSE